MNPDGKYYAQVRLLVTVLPAIRGEECFALKGGTAINLFVRDMPRLSVDIDLVYLPIEDRRQSIDNVRAALERVGEQILHTVPNVRIKLATNRSDELRLLIERDHTQVKIEVSPVLRGVLHAPEIKAVRPQVEEAFGFAEILVSSIPDIYGGKICAALDRQHPRDLFDVMLLLENEGLTRDIFEAFLVYLISHNRPMIALLAPQPKELEPAYTRDFEGMTRMPVTLETLENIRDKLIFGIRKLFTESDKQFILSVKRGEPQWDLLGLPGIDQLPAVRWKLQNLQRMPKAKHVAAVARLEAALDDF